ncbi:hypothetical protein [Lysinibacillus capsici]|uniref:hypothetical protein n=1 Tax=Lysinibacillus capsici TaxID=2115968 RepID=UPI0024816471|nr:hypothetical protein [Lysinibacillus capsici]
MKNILIILYILLALTFLVIFLSNIKRISEKSPNTLFSRGKNNIKLIILIESLWSLISILLFNFSTSEIRWWIIFLPILFLFTTLISYFIVWLKIRPVFDNKISKKVKKLVSQKALDLNKDVLLEKVETYIYPEKFSTINNVIIFFQGEQKCSLELLQWAEDLKNDLDFLVVIHIYLNNIKIN